MAEGVGVCAMGLVIGDDVTDRCRSRVTQGPSVGGNECCAGTARTGNRNKQRFETNPSPNISSSSSGSSGGGLLLRAHSQEGSQTT